MTDKNTTSRNARAWKLHVLYEDNWIIVVEKPSGLLSVGNPTSKDINVWTLVREHVRKLNYREDAFVCHRLDQYTSGILLFAKSEAIQHTLRDSWNDYILDRRYVAVTEVIPNPPKAEIRSRLVENSAMFVYSTRKPDEGKLAVTRYRIIAQNKTQALLDVQILTGRKNQIRVHLSEHGWPIAGDKKYGAKTNPIGRLLLHNNKLAFIHPVSREPLVFELPIPQCFLTLFQGIDTK